ncbi:MAG: response regulator transcription factor [Lewinellaceae bacterium]|nr:response regulator transcription factor [Saprospiraceae bacterium]MCB0545042.1 response regulator transcription factor [Saprospiraceae bacterium]MCB9307492.1 response regulator transcription factor [Lewinellaceae bacterium]MCB9355336.1 response regulator transcription factor [Lewinellaceae bacterium]
MIRVVIADDHRLVLAGFKALLEDLDFVEVLGEARNGKELLGLLRSGVRPDVVLVDHEMPLMNGLEAAAAIREEFFGVRIIMLTMMQDKNLIEAAIAGGVHGFLFKNASLDELGLAIKKVAGGEPYFSGDVTLTLMQRQTGFGLSEREMEILKLVARGHTSAEIGSLLFISPRTVDTHRNNILNKLDVQGIAGLVEFAVKNKLV